MAHSILKTQALGKRVNSPEGELVLLERVEMHVAAGETVAVVGASGSGKSTLLGLLAGLDEPSEGEVFIAGQALFELDEDGRAALRAAKLGFVFQNFQLLDNLTALENVMLPLELAGRKDAQEYAKEVLAKVELAHRLHHYPKQLSGGEQQRVAIARAFAPNPALMLADEPTGNLDSATGERIIDLLFQLNSEQQTTLVLVTHDRGLAQRCQRRLELHQGQLRELS
ncbi:MAG: ABC transporter ATP-binding protein [Gammaproteobacteria bacterium]|nr:ABC transporter ATP-binding protein [Gammaproteobacteria bacterium]